MLDPIVGAPDLNLGLITSVKVDTTASRDQIEMPLYMQLLGSESSQCPLSDVYKVSSDHADLSLSLSLPEHSKRPKVNTSLQLFG